MKAKNINIRSKSKSVFSKIGSVFFPRNNKSNSGKVQIKSRLGNIFQEELATIDSFVGYTPSLTPVPGKGIKISR